MPKMIKMVSALLISSSLLGAGAVPASAFSDIKDSGDLAIVKSLQDKGIIQGVTADKFVPQTTITAAQAVQMVVKATGLKPLPNISGKSFSTVPDGAWYAEAVNIAAQHGLPVSAEMKWNEPMTREDFANLLATAIQKTGNYPVVKMYVHIADENQMKEESRGAVQFLVLTKMAKLDKEAKFHPKQNLTRMEAARMTHAAMQFIQSHKQGGGGGEEQSGEEASTQIVKINDKVNKVIITKENLPHPGYGITVTSIDFVSDKQAIVYYQIVQPDPNKFYPQVISSASTETYVPSQYEVKVKAAPGNSVQGPDQIR
ncbi:S-layer homology domain-containing protein [Paenibacillus faecalis]|uniref:S-layer homology domain-containing protein n=1 Tax=Paenibacillus faecalis TaxID=2079532 RepID=UPI000D104064|nr:S-layer homology domain-containing protein [Paenibacillus faecalis]